jgi:hypothetical protein
MLTWVRRPHQATSCSGMLRLEEHSTLVGPCSKVYTVKECFLVFFRTVVMWELAVFHVESIVDSNSSRSELSPQVSSVIGSRSLCCLLSKTARYARASRKVSFSWCGTGLASLEEFLVEERWIMNTTVHQSSLWTIPGCKDSWTLVNDFLSRHYQRIRTDRDKKYAHGVYTTSYQRKDWMAETSNNSRYVSNSQSSNGAHESNWKIRIVIVLKGMHWKVLHEKSKNGAYPCLEDSRCVLSWLLYSLILRPRKVRQKRRRNVTYSTGIVPVYHTRHETHLIVEQMSLICCAFFLWFLAWIQTRLLCRGVV